MTRGRPVAPVDSPIVHTSLRELAIAFGTDKEGAHAYSGPYERHLAALRDRPVRLLEIGVGGDDDPTAGGASLRMWKHYFPLGEIVGLDIFDKSALTEERITILRGDQGDSAFLEALGRDHGPFDIVIDDGSHHCADVIASFGALFRFVKDGGWYVIEDTQTSYWPAYAAGSGPTRTTMEMVKRLIDGLNYAEFDSVNYSPSDTDIWVRSVSVFHNIAFIEKGPNTEGSNVLPPHPHSKRFHGRPSLPRRALRKLGATVKNFRR
jgi:hypothetical protein